MDYKAVTFENDTVVLDGNTFEGCTFINCTIKYGGGATQFSGTTRFNGECSVEFVGIANNVYGVVRFLLNGIGFNIEQAMGRAPEPGAKLQ